MVEHLTVPSYEDMNLLTNIRLGFKCAFATKTSAYFLTVSKYTKLSFIKLAQAIKKFIGRILFSKSTFSRFCKKMNFKMKIFLMAV
jgi:hypothetical protein